MDNDIAADTEAVLAWLGDALQEIDREVIRGFLKYGEYELALDTLCEQMCERNAVPTTVTYEKIMDLLSRTKMDQTHYRACIPSPKR